MQTGDTEINYDELLRLIQNSKILQQMPESQRQNFILKIFNTTDENKLILYNLLIKESEIIKGFDNQKTLQKSIILKKYISKLKTMLCRGDKMILCMSEQEDKKNEEKSLKMLLNDI